MDPKYREDHERMHTFLGQHMKDKDADFVMDRLLPIMANRYECMDLINWLKLMCGREP